MRDFFTKNPLMKLIALTLSVALWWFVRSERQNEKTVDVPVVYSNPPQDLIFSSVKQENIRLRVRGPQSKLAKVDDDYLSSYVIDLASSNEGPNTYWLYEEDFQLPFGVYVTQIYPQAIRVELVPKKNEKINIRPQFSGELPPGIEINGVSVVPPSVSYESYQDELDTIEYFRTEPIKLSGRTRDFEGTYRIDNKNFKGSLVTDTVKVVVDLIEKEIDEVISSVPIELPPQLKGAQLEPDNVSITVRGPLSKVLTLVTTPPTPTLDDQGVAQVQETKKDQEVFLRMEVVEDVSFELVPEKVWVRFPEE